MRALRELVLVLAVVAVAALAIHQWNRPATQPASSASSASSSARSPSASGGHVCADAEGLRKAKRWREAAEAYTDCLAADPRDNAALFYRASCYTALNDHAHAIADLSASLALVPDGAAYNNLAWERCETGDYAGALGAAENSLAMDAESVRITAAKYDTKAYALVGLRRYKEALAAVDKGLGLEPNDPFLLARRKQILALQAGVPAPHPNLQAEKEACLAP